jgi:Gram-negative bacterial TonB protein C-terminal
MRIIVSISLILMVAITTYSQDGTSDLPEVLTAVAPIFPPILVAANISGRSTLEVTVDAKGEVTSTKVIEGHPLINQMTRLFDETLSRWRFSIAKEQGKSRTARIAFVFTIVPEHTPEADLTTIFRPYEVEIRHRPASETYKFEPKH